MFNSQIFYQKISNLLFTLGIFGNFLGATPSPSQAMDDEKPFRFSHRKLQSLDDESKWQQNEIFIRVHDLYLSNQAIYNQIELNGKKFTFNFNERTQQFIKETPEIFTFIKWELASQQEHLPFGFEIGDSHYKAEVNADYKLENASKVRTYLTSYAPALFKKLDECIPDNPTSYGLILKFTPTEKLCFKYLCLFPNQFFEENIVQKDLEYLHKAKIKLDKIEDKERKHSIMELLCCAHMNQLPVDLDTLLVGLLAAIDIHLKQINTKGP